MVAAITDHRKGNEFSKATKKAAFIRCSQPDGVPKCERCGQPLKAGRYEFDHRKSAALGGDNSLGNCDVICSGGRATCHGIKTHEEDRPLIQKADNMRDAHLGLTRVKKKIPQPPRAPKKPSKPALPPKQLFKKAS